MKAFLVTRQPSPFPALHALTMKTEAESFFEKSAAVQTYDISTQKNKIVWGKQYFWYSRWWGVLFRLRNVMKLILLQ
jgi:hypothetical protein